MNATCKLCHLQKPLRRSHIIPKGAYKPIYDVRHRAIAVHSESRRPKLVQQGLIDLLLCEDCEQKLCRIERAFLRFWGWKVRFPKSLSQLYIPVPGIDYHNTKLFLLSVIWRAGVSTRKELSGVQLGCHGELLRDILWDERKVAESVYPVSGILLRDPTTGSPATKIVFTPAETRRNGTQVYIMAFLGCAWQVAISNGDMQLPFPDDCILKEAGTLILPIVDANRHAAIRQLLHAHPAP